MRHIVHETILLQLRVMRTSWIPWPIIHLMLEATSHCIDLAVNIEFGQSAPTAEEQAVLSQYGKIHDVDGELWFRREANTTSSVD